MTRGKIDGDRTKSHANFPADTSENAFADCDVFVDKHILPLNSHYSVISGGDKTFDYISRGEVSPSFLTRSSQNGFWIKIQIQWEVSTL